MKVIISNLAWIKRIDIDEVTLHLVRNELTIIPKAMGAFSRTEPIRLYAMNSDWLGMPRPYYFSRKHLFKNSFEEYRIAKGEEIPELKTDIVLRPEDQEPMAKFVEEYFKSKMFAGAAVEAWTAFGKSFTALDIIRRMRLNTLVILHRESLLNQWVESAKRFFNNEVSIGKVQGTNIDYRDRHITFSMLQTLMTENNDKFPKDFFNHFGLIVVDENHILGAEKFGSVLPKFSNKYTLLISGTQRRADGCENVFKFCGGEVIYKASEKNRIRPVIYVRNTQFVPKDKRGRVKQIESKISGLKSITESKLRNQYIAKDVIKAVKAGRYPLVMSERLEQLRNIREQVQKIALADGLNLSHGFYVGDRSEDELKRAATCDIVYATIQMAKEGVDIPRLCCLFLASPLSEIEQISGRICRRHPDKKPPFFIDYVDLEITPFRSSFVNRYILYNKLKFEVKGIEGKEFNFLKYVR